MRSSMPSRRPVLKPAACVTREYVPGSRNGSVYAPSVLLVVLTTTLVATLVAVTLALGTTAPEESRMLPCMVPRVSCPKAAETKSRLQKNAAAPLRRFKELDTVDLLSDPET